MLSRFSTVLYSKPINLFILLRAAFLLHPDTSVGVRSSGMSAMESLRHTQKFHSTNLLSENLDQPSNSPEPSYLHVENTCSSSVCSTPDIEKKYVHRIYDAIAPHFSSTRFAKWPKVASFLNSLQPGSVILDAGCGNGKYLGLNPDCFYIGCDISPSLVEICTRKGHEVMVADAVDLPYRENFGDAAISIAVLHHLSTDSRRIKAIEELVRVVRKGGLILITVWAVEQEDKSLLTKWTPLCHKYDDEWVKSSNPPVRGNAATKLECIPELDESCRQTSSRLFAGEVESRTDKVMDGASIPCSISEGEYSSNDGLSETQQEYFVPWHLPYHRAEISGASASALESGLAKKDDKKGALVYNRYYHVFVEGELQRLVSGINNASIVDQFYDKSNWCIVLEKI
ncbi:tRNA (carboxymethyluridine(34)-5-O)-methyltransferase-like [Zingiber officinale]|uniref:tRNA (carboxymethyluridine(34)-5-O)-methyltransferase-like n=1 Tax=Zingiber officinale TaxID=94328 RepID=UPI001C4B87FC|nr:tRNA (carboxymethyluridine(34)-5-O)-methyltransferase-like [Zingiber officinale]XP_042429543.1 tRNA (carboxymethyluridine(34)-5-O)-methyltransferase-like [Zingiber officinale]